MIKCAIWYLLLLSLFFHASCDPLRPLQDRVVISVGEKDITLDAFRRDLELIAMETDLNTEEVRSVFDMLVERLLERYMLLAHGEKLGVALSEHELENAVREIKADYPSENEFNEMLLKRYVDMEVWKEQLGKQLLMEKIIARGMEQLEPATFEEIKHFYDQNRDFYKHNNMIKIRQIIIRDEDKAYSILELAKGKKELSALEKVLPATFETAMVIPERWTAEDEVDEALGDALFSLPLGLAPSPLKTPYGYHVVEVTGRLPAGVKRLPEVISQIEEKLMAEKQEAFFSEWIETLRSRYPVKLNKDLLTRLEIG